jgi:hypothetical protein
MCFTQFDNHRGRWVLTSAECVVGGGTIDAAPVRIIEHDDTPALAKTLRDVLAEDHPVVPEPDWNDSRFTVGIRVQAVGLNSWRTYVRHTRAFLLRDREGTLVLEEWPREGHSFAAKPVWQREFPPNSFDLVAKYLVDITAPSATQKKRSR